MIVVAGGSGLVGRQVVNDLLLRGEQVRVLVRDAGRARAVLGYDVDVRAADVRQPGLDEVLGGASVVVSAVHGFLGGRGAGPRDVDERGNANLIGAAAMVGASVVLVSVIGAAADGPLELFRAKYAAEQHLFASGAPWTIVRASPFMETWLGILTQTAGKSGRPVLFGHGHQPIAFASATDVAAVVSRACTDTTLRGQLLEVAGEPISMTELAHVLQAARGWNGTVHHIPRPVLRALAALARPVNPAFARKNQAAAFMDTDRSYTPTTEAARVLGRAPLKASDVITRLGSI
ncbi:NAD(P)H-binding protein [Paenarthrobacter sp. PH39-S1]|uniref:SDR family oxidoreductase n=1 Tax=Paenarthrobacter sp. PH39-S1 TaxID=3046204 RepID=UPI0024BBCB32|nr:NAD(P)H-binding protein [Paenarthrobacter sp. PH39-S1]MDJ0356874.1 NAD(P)H-binding protein [Paenarthrobacter sp. PH39-S1]